MVETGIGNIYDPEMLEYVSTMIQEERTALWDARTEAFSQMRFLNQPVRSKLQGIINITDALKTVPVKERMRIRARIQRISKYIMHYVRQNKPTDELEQRLDVLSIGILLHYQRDIRSHMLAASVERETGTGEGYELPAPPASFNQELGRAKYGEEVWEDGAVRQALGEKDREIEKLRQDLANKKQTGRE